MVQFRNYSNSWVSTPQLLFVLIDVTQRLSVWSRALAELTAVHVKQRFVSWQSAGNCCERIQQVCAGRNDRNLCVNRMNAPHWICRTQLKVTASRSQGCICKTCALWWANAKCICSLNLHKLFRPHPCPKKITRQQYLFFIHTLSQRATMRTRSVLSACC